MKKALITGITGQDGAYLTDLQRPCPEDTIIRIDPRYFRPSEVETLRGDPSKARKQLDWHPATTFEEMMIADLEETRRDAMCRREGFKICNFHE